MSINRYKNGATRNTTHKLPPRATQLRGPLSDKHPCTDAQWTKLFRLKVIAADDYIADTHRPSKRRASELIDAAIRAQNQEVLEQTHRQD